MGVWSDHVGPAVFDFMGRRFESDFAPLRQPVLAHARGRVLEIGGGTGFNLAHYPAEVDEVVLTEPSAGMLRRAQKRAAEASRPVSFVEAHAEQLPFEDDSFDTVVSTLVLCSVDDQERALSEIRRVLKPGGRFLFIEHVRSDDPKLSRWQDRLDRPWGAVCMGCHPNRSTLAALKENGFELEAVEHGELPKSPPLVRPMVSGRATA